MIWRWYSVSCSFSVPDSLSRFQRRAWKLRSVDWDGSTVDVCKPYPVFRRLIFCIFRLGTGSKKRRVCRRTETVRGWENVRWKRDLFGESYLVFRLIRKVKLIFTFEGVFEVERVLSENCSIIFLPTCDFRRAQPRWGEWAKRSVFSFSSNSIKLDSKNCFLTCSARFKIYFSSAARCPSPGDSNGIILVQRSGPFAIVILLIFQQ